MSGKDNKKIISTSTEGKAAAELEDQNNPHTGLTNIPSKDEAVPEFQGAVAVEEKSSTNTKDLTNSPQTSSKVPQGSSEGKSASDNKSAVQEGAEKQEGIDCAAVLQGQAPSAVAESPVLESEVPGPIEAPEAEARKINESLLDHTQVSKYFLQNVNVYNKILKSLKVNLFPADVEDGEEKGEDIRERPTIDQMISNGYLKRDPRKKEGEIIEESDVTFQDIQRELREKDSCFLWCQESKNKNPYIIEVTNVRISIWTSKPGEKVRLESPLNLPGRKKEKVLVRVYSTLGQARASWFATQEYKQLTFGDGVWKSVDSITITLLFLGSPKAVKLWDYHQATRVYSGNPVTTVVNVEQDRRRTGIKNLKTAVGNLEQSQRDKADFQFKPEFLDSLKPNDDPDAKKKIELGFSTPERGLPKQRDVPNTPGQIEVLVKLKHLMSEVRNTSWVSFKETYPKFLYTERNLGVDKGDQLRMIDGVDTKKLDRNIIKKWINCRGQIIKICIQKEKLRQEQTLKQRKENRATMGADSQAKNSAISLAQVNSSANMSRTPTFFQGAEGAVDSGSKPTIPVIKTSKVKPKKLESIQWLTVLNHKYYCRLMGKISGKRVKLIKNDMAFSFSELHNQQQTTKCNISSGDVVVGYKNKDYMKLVPSGYSVPLSIGQAHDIFKPLEKVEKGKKEYIYDEPLSRVKQCELQRKIQNASMDLLHDVLWNQLCNWRLDVYADFFVAILVENCFSLYWSELYFRSKIKRKKNPGYNWNQMIEALRAADMNVSLQNMQTLARSVGNLFNEDHYVSYDDFIKVVQYIYEPTIDRYIYVSRTCLPFRDFTSMSLNIQLEDGHEMRSRRASLIQTVEGWYEVCGVENGRVSYRQSPGIYRLYWCGYRNKWIFTPDRTFRFPKRSAESMLIVPPTQGKERIEIVSVENPVNPKFPPGTRKFSLQNGFIPNTTEETYWRVWLPDDQAYGQLWLHLRGWNQSAMESKVVTRDLSEAFGCSAMGSPALNLLSTKTLFLRWNVSEWKFATKPRAMKSKIVICDFNVPQTRDIALELQQSGADAVIFACPQIPNDTHFSPEIYTGISALMIDIPVLNMFDVKWWQEVNNYTLQRRDLEDYGLKSTLISKQVLEKGVFYILNPAEKNRQYSSYHTFALSKHDKDDQKKEQSTDTKEDVDSAVINFNKSTLDSELCWIHNASGGFEKASRDGLMKVKGRPDLKESSEEEEPEEYYVQINLETSMTLSGVVFQLPKRGTLRGLGAVELDEDSKYPGVVADDPGFVHTFAVKHSADDHTWTSTTKKGFVAFNIPSKRPRPVIQDTVENRKKTKFELRKSFDTMMWEHEKKILEDEEQWEKNNIDRKEFIVFAAPLHDVRHLRIYPKEWAAPVITEDKDRKFLKKWGYPACRVGLLIPESMIDVLKKESRRLNRIGISCTHSKLPDFNTSLGLCAVPSGNYFYMSSSLRFDNKPQVQQYALDAKGHNFFLLLKYPSGHRKFHVMSVDVKSKSVGRRIRESVFMKSEQCDRFDLAPDGKMLLTVGQRNEEGKSIFGIWKTNNFSNIKSFEADTAEVMKVEYDGRVLCLGTQGEGNKPDKLQLIIPLSKIELDRLEGKTHVDEKKKHGFWDYLPVSMRKLSHREETYEEIKHAALDQVSTLTNLEEKYPEAYMLDQVGVADLREGEVIEMVNFANRREDENLLEKSNKVDYRELIIPPGEKLMGLNISIGDIKELDDNELVVLTNKSLSNINLKLDEQDDSSFGKQKWKLYFVVQLKPGKGQVHCQSKKIVITDEKNIRVFELKNGLQLCPSIPLADFNLMPIHSNSSENHVNITVEISEKEEVIFLTTKREVLVIDYWTGWVIHQKLFPKDLVIVAIPQRRNHKVLLWNRLTSDFFFEELIIDRSVFSLWERANKLPPSTVADQ